MVGLAIIAYGDGAIDNIRGVSTTSVVGHLRVYRGVSYGIAVGLMYPIGGLFFGAFALVVVPVECIKVFYATI